MVCQYKSVVYKSNYLYILQLTLIMKLSVLCSAEMPGALLWAAAAVAAAVAVAAPIRAAGNLYSFLRRDRPTQR